MVGQAYAHSVTGLCVVTTSWRYSLAAAAAATVSDSGIQALISVTHSTYTSEVGLLAIS